MIDLIIYFYYRVKDFYSGFESEKDTAGFTSVCIVSLMECLNILIAYGCIIIILGKPVRMNSWFWVSVVICIGIFNYFFLGSEYASKRYSALISKETVPIRRRKGYLIILYIILSAIFVYFTSSTVFNRKLAL
jgi:hypothetical protein